MPKLKMKDSNLNIRNSLKGINQTDPFRIPPKKGLKEEF